jgi:TRAP-type mannitol/chloroaromatic compound transport system substrate-binding protein
MERREFLRNTGASATAGLTATLAAPAIAQGLPTVKWRLSSSYPKSLDILYGGAEALAKRVAAVTDGKFEIRVFAPGEIVPAFGVVDALQQGSIECAYTAPFYFFGKDPTIALGAAIPFGMNSRQMTAWTFAGGGLQLMREFYREYNIINFACGNTGAQMGGWFRKEVKTLDDIKGLKFRIGGFAGKVLERIGGVPQSIPAGDVYPALEKGTIDAAEWVGPYDDEKLGFNKIAKFYYYPCWWEGCSQADLYVNLKAWEALPKQYQLILESAAGETHVEVQANYDAKNPAALKRLVAGGAQLRAFPRAFLDAAWKASNEIYDELSKTNPKWKKVYESYSKFRDEEILWFRFAETGFDSFMASVKK